MEILKNLTSSFLTSDTLESVIDLTKKRCPWVDLDKPDYVDYYDLEWGMPVHDDNKHFKMFILKGVQAGLSWYTILKHHKAYYKLFKQFNPCKVALMNDAELESILTNTKIIRNRLKVFAARKNAQVFLDIQQKFGSFNDYIWQFVGGNPKVNLPKTIKDLPARTLASDLLSKDLKKCGMSFVGSTIIYAHMQATDHTADCFVHKQRTNNVT
jgi:DNA-3-methyladenine glycosylase I